MVLLTIKLVCVAYDTAMALQSHVLLRRCNALIWCVAMLCDLLNNHTCMSLTHKSAYRS
jgi:hypothetical protein